MNEKMTETQEIQTSPILAFLDLMPFPEDGQEEVHAIDCDCSTCNALATFTINC